MKSLSEQDVARIDRALDRAGVARRCSACGSDDVGTATQLHSVFDPGHVEGLRGPAAMRVCRRCGHVAHHLIVALTLPVYDLDYLLHEWGKG